MARGGGCYVSGLCSGSCALWCWAWIRSSSSSRSLALTTCRAESWHLAAIPAAHLAVGQYTQLKGRAIRCSRMAAQASAFKAAQDMKQAKLPCLGKEGPTLPALFLTIWFITKLDFQFNPKEQRLACQQGITRGATGTLISHFYQQGFI